MSGSVRLLTKCNKDNFINIFSELIWVLSIFSSDVIQNDAFISDLFVGCLSAFPAPIRIMSEGLTRMVLTLCAAGYSTGASLSGRGGGRASVLLKPMA